MKITIDIVGKTRAEILENLLTQLDALHALIGADILSPQEKEVVEEKVEKLPQPKSKGRPPAKKVEKAEDEANVALGAAKEIEDEKPAPSVYSREDLLSALREFGDKATVFKILSEKFKVKSINDLAPEQYGEVIKAVIASGAK